MTAESAFEAYRTARANYFAAGVAHRDAPTPTSQATSFSAYRRMVLASRDYQRVGKAHAVAAYDAACHGGKE